MGKALELVSGFVTAPSTAFTAWTMASGNTLAVRNTDLSTKIRLLEAWSDQQTAGNLRIRSPRLHDNVQGIRLFSVASEVAPLLAYDDPQMLIPQDLLTVEQTGSATGGDIESGSLLIHYDDLPGIEARLISPEDLNRRALSIMACENSLALGTAGGYSGEETIVSEFDNWKANMDYALVGYQVSAECNCVRWRGSDSGNLGVGGPGNELRKDLTANWFVYLSRRFGIPLIPVFNAANRFAILIDGMQDENGTDVIVTSIFVELAP